MTCGRCQFASYCGRECQVGDLPRHREECKSQAKVLAAQKRCSAAQLMTAQAKVLSEVPVAAQKRCSAAEVMTADSNISVIDSGTDLGRVVVAKRDIAPGEVVLHEDPLLIWRDDGAGDEKDISMMQAFARASPATREALLGLYHPPLSSAEGERAQEHAEMLVHDRGIEVAVEKVQRLLMIHACSTHNFRRVEDFDGPSEVIYATGTEIAGNYAALFAIGSQVEHSCLPNAVYRSSSGHLLYLAARAIRAGKRVSFAYSSDDPERTLQERRDRLLATKFFICQCVLCRGPEMNRPLTCRISACSGLSLRTDGSWTCAECGSVKDDDEQASKERKLVEVFERTKQKVHRNMRPGAFSKTS